MIDFVRFQTKNEPVLWTREYAATSTDCWHVEIKDRQRRRSGLVARRPGPTELVGATKRRQTEYDSDVRLSLHIRGCVSQRGVARHRIRRRCNRTSRRFTPVFGTDVRISGV